jgi:hypothetical protein
MSGPAVVAMIVSPTIPRRQIATTEEIDRSASASAGYYGPTLKAFEAVGEEGAEAQCEDIWEPFASSTEPTMRR